MKRQTRMLAGTAIALLMAAAPVLAASRAFAPAESAPDATTTAPLLLAQEDAVPLPEGEEPLPPKKAPPAEEPPPAEPAPQPEAQPAPAEPAPEPAPAEIQPEQPPAPAPEAPAPEAPAPEAPAVEAPAVEPPPAPPAPAVEPAPQPETAPAPAPEAPAVEPPPAPAPEAPAIQPAPEQPAAPAPEAPVVQPETPAVQPEAPVVQPAPEAPAVQPEAPAPDDGQAGAEPAPSDGGNAPIFDSQKQAPGAQPADPAVIAEPATPSAPPPASDAAAQESAQPAAVMPVEEEKGVRVERAPDAPLRRERPDGLEVLREIGDRVIIQFGDNVSVESNDRPRMSRGARDVYYEDLPRGRTRETIVRRDGTRIVTVRNEYGDVIRRSRITPDDREYILAYVDEDNYGRGDWRDPGLDLPPLVIDIPADEYILDSASERDPEAYYTFLDQPPVERVERLYSLDEVKRSARIRDKTRRIDLDTLTFGFGSAEIAESEIARLDSVAKAMEKILATNPAETFLIEGHTDAVGSNVANLALSDRRAEAVADALTNVFAIPPENLATQGYGEAYLKVRTQAPEQENRRVAIRRITALVAPVAKAK